jgi:diadenosine tetraphosphate (Ap4A) HIT family hydrolase
VAVTDLPFSEVRLERRSLLPGYCIVVWKFGHVAEPTQLDDDGATGYWRDVLSVVRAIEARFKPMKINLLTLGNWVPHLHTHVVPRYRDDPAPGGPIAYEAMFAEAPMPTAELQRHAEGIRAGLTR